MPQNNKSELDMYIEATENAIKIIGIANAQNLYLTFNDAIELAKSVQSELAALRAEVEEIRSVLPKKGNDKVE